MSTGVIPTEVLKAVLSATSVAGDDPTRYTITGVSLHKTEEAFVVRATDGHILISRRIPCADTAPKGPWDCSLFTDKASLGSFKAFLKHVGNIGEVSAEVRPDDSVMLSFAGQSLTLPGTRDFPDCAAVIPDYADTDTRVCVAFNSELLSDLVAALGRHKREGGAVVLQFDALNPMKPIRVLACDQPETTLVLMPMRLGGVKENAESLAKRFGRTEHRL